MESLESIDVFLQDFWELVMLLAERAFYWIVGTIISALAGALFMAIVSGFFKSFKNALENKGWRGFLFCLVLWSAALLSLFYAVDLQTWWIASPGVIIVAVLVIGASE